MNTFEDDDVMIFSIARFIIFGQRGSCATGRGVLETEGARGTRVAAKPAAANVEEDRTETLEGILRPVVVAAYHLGASADQLRKALERAMKGIFGLVAQDADVARAASSSLAWRSPRHRGR
jgi:hypothetical protein